MRTATRGRCTRRRALRGPKNAKPPDVQYYVAPRNAGSPYQTAAGSAYASSTTLTDVSPGGSTTPLVIPYTQYMAGSVFRLTAWGVFSTTGTPTLLLGFYYGGVAGSALCATTATTTGSGVSNIFWRAQAEVRITTLGSSGAAVSHGFAYGFTAAAPPILMPASSASGNSVTINTTTNNAWTCGAQWGTSSASNTLTCYYFMIEQLA